MCIQSRFLEEAVHSWSIELLDMDYVSKNKHKSHHSRCKKLRYIPNVRSAHEITIKVEWRFIIGCGFKARKRQ
jgi:hypothetical protein